MLNLDGWFLVYANNSTKGIIGAKIDAQIIMYVCIMHS